MAGIARVGEIAPAAGVGNERNDSARGELIAAYPLGEAYSSDAGAAASGRASSAESAYRLEGVTVTAQKYGQRALDVPISLAVIGAGELQRLQVANLDDLEAVVPGLTVEDTGTTLRLTIRGMSNIFGQGALVGTYLDEADVTTGSTVGIDLNTYDLKRVEVLRGPQGTLYGEGSIGGTIRYITNTPNLDAFEMTADVAALFTQYGGPGERVQAVLNAPIVTHDLGLRVAGDFEHDGGWVDQPFVDLKNINTKDIADARIEGLWEPIENLKVGATQIIHRGKLGPFIGEDSKGNYTQTFSLATTPVLQDDYDVSNITVDWAGAYVQLVNTATYLWHDLRDWHRGATYQFTPPPSPRFNYYFPEAETLNRSLSDELRASGASIGGWRWTLGGFYRHFTDVFPPSFYYFAIPGAPGSALPSRTFPAFHSGRSNSWSGFADTNYLLLSKLTLGAGIRYYRDAETYTAQVAGVEQTGTFTSADPRAYVRYAVTPNANIYASAAKGFRSGGFNALGQPPFRPETAWTYELGTKLSGPDNRLGADFDVFLSDYSGYQIVGIAPPPAPPLNITRNAGTARIKGVEGDVSWSPGEHWRVRVSGDYINARFVEIAVQKSSYQVGDPLDLFPRYQATGSVERDFSWMERAAYANVSYSQRARESYRNRSIGPWYYSESDYLYLLNFDSGIQWTPALNFGLFAENILNDRGYTGAFVIENNAARARPRTVGIRFRVSFE